MPEVRLLVGCHPHNAKDFDAQAHAAMQRLLAEPICCGVGEIGLDYHYDLSPREDQERAFRAQVRIAKEAGLPVMLHVREAHDDALAIMRDEGWPEAGCILHCFTSDWKTLEPWIDAGCSVTFGGALTFNNGDAIRDAAARVPEMQLMVETDSPYMAPKPLRGEVCEPAMVVFTESALADVRGAEGEERLALFRRVLTNAESMLNRPPTAWQLGK